MVKANAQQCVNHDNGDAVEKIAASLVEEHLVVSFSPLFDRNPIFQMTARELREVIPQYKSLVRSLTDLADLKYRIEMNGETDIPLLERRDRLENEAGGLDVLGDLADDLEDIGASDDVIENVINGDMFSDGMGFFLREQNRKQLVADQIKLIQQISDFARVTEPVRTLPSKGGRIQLVTPPGNRDHVTNARRKFFRADQRKTSRSLLNKIKLIVDQYEIPKDQEQLSTILNAFSIECNIEFLNLMQGIFHSIAAEDSKNAFANSFSFDDLFEANDRLEAIMDCVEAWRHGKPARIPENAMDYLRRSIPRVIYMAETSFKRSPGIADDTPLWIYVGYYLVQQWVQLRVPAYPNSSAIHRYVSSLLCEVARYARWHELNSPDMCGQANNLEFEEIPYPFSSHQMELMIKSVRKTTSSLDDIKALIPQLDFDQVYDTEMWEFG